MHQEPSTAMIWALINVHISEPRPAGFLIQRRAALQHCRTAELSGLQQWMKDVWLTVTRPPTHPHVPHIGHLTILRKHLNLLILDLRFSIWDFPSNMYWYWWCFCADYSREYQNARAEECWAACYHVSTVWAATERIKQGWSPYYVPCCLLLFVSSHTETRRADGDVVISHSAAALHTATATAAPTAVISTRNCRRGKILHIITVTGEWVDKTQIPFILVYLSMSLRVDLLNSWFCRIYDFLFFTCVTPCIFNKQRACLNIWYNLNWRINDGRWSTQQRSQTLRWSYFILQTAIMDNLITPSIPDTRWCFTDLWLYPPVINCINCSTAQWTIDNVSNLCLGDQHFIEWLEDIQMI